MSKKNFLNITFACCLAVWLASCSKEDNPSVPEPVGSEYAVSQIRDVTVGSEHSGVATYTYDIMGRPLEHVVEGYVETDRYGITSNYTYGDREIVGKESQTLRDVFKLDDSGHIVEDIHYPEVAAPYTLTFTYDEKGQIATYDADESLYEFHWKDGDLMGWDQIADGKVISTATIEYTDIESEYCLMSSVFSSWDVMLYARGYYGKVSRHLPLRVKKMSVTDAPVIFYIEDIYTYELTDGRVTSYTCQGEMETTMFGQSIKTKRTSTYQVSWKKL